MLTQNPAAAERPAINERLNRLSDYPFTRLAALLGDAGPQVNRPPLVMSVGEPQHAPPALPEQTLRENAHLWNKYPPVAGTREALFMVAQLCVPDRTALFYLCSLSNPQGSAADLPYLKRIITPARRWNFVPAMDECYAEIYLDAAAAALWRDDAHVAENRALYREKFACAEAVPTGRLGCRRPAGGFFLWLDAFARIAPDLYHRFSALGDGDEDNLRGMLVATTRKYF